MTWRSAGTAPPIGSSTGFNLIPANFTLALFPLLSRRGQADRAALARVYRRALKVLLLLGVPICVGTALLAEPLVLFFAGPAYVPAGRLGAARPRSGSCPSAS